MQLRSLHLLFVAVAAVSLASTATTGSILDVGEVGNHFKVTYSIVPGPLTWSAFFTMPRSLAEAKQDDFAQAVELAERADKTTVWCRKGDYRVCVLFDRQGSVAGIQMSAAVDEIKKSQIPVEVEAVPEWFRQRLLGVDVYTTIAFFVPTDVLLGGGRPLDKDTPTAPNGLYLLQTDKDGVETGRLHVAKEQSSAAAAGFVEQACFHGMGNHCFQALDEQSKCDEPRPYFTLYDPKAKQMSGFGFAMFGEVSKGRGWFESPSAQIVKTIAPHSPECLTEWVNKYNLFTMHVFFDQRPWNYWC